MHIHKDTYKHINKQTKERKYIHQHTLTYIDTYINIQANKQTNKNKIKKQQKQASQDSNGYTFNSR